VNGARAVIVLCGVAACGTNVTASPQHAAEANPGSAHAAASVEVVPVVSRPLDTTVHLQGELGPWEVVAIYPRVTGFVASIGVDRASVVHRGQVLARLVAPELASQRAEAQARTRADQSTLERLRAAAQTPGVVAGHDVELAEAAVQADRAHVRALAELEQYLVVSAPFDGVVTERDVHPGALVGPQTGAGTPMLRMQQIARLRLTVAVPEAFVGSIAEGASANFNVRAWPGRTFAGTIVRPSHSVDTQTRTMAVELDVANADSALSPGMYADVAWPVRRTTPSLFVPRTAVVQTTERTFVVRVHDGVTETVPVQRGASVGDLVEVTGDLRPSDTIARRGSEDLRSGTRVTVRLAPPADGGAGSTGAR
jgi:RND family efflux transporter MFP subunit